ncbi:co-chaperone GroES [Fusobacterium sp.]|uniref:co-chaperone GroES n=1 Tax=Fusobacterium sp. TaxID=68766 RepID=UPI00260CA033|nr:co-chaperone GroES [Fusobacterium sp.]
MIIKPIGKRVLIKPLKAEEKTMGGIILTSSYSQVNSNMGEIVAIGDSNNMKILKIGDKIIHLDNVGTKIKDGNDEYIIIDFDDIVGIVEI